MTVVVSLDQPLSLKTLRAVHESPARVDITPATALRIDSAAAAIAKIIESGTTVYGVNTGFGLLATTTIPHHELEELQRNLVLSHACGVGPLLQDNIVRLVMVLKLASLSRGASGVRRETVEMLARLLELDIYPCVPSKGSVGASGDLAPLAHLSAMLLGIGKARVTGQIIPAG